MLFLLWLRRERYIKFDWLFVDGKFYNFLLVFGLLKILKIYGIVLIYCIKGM